jgi:hypothetical protein
MPTQITQNSDILRTDVQMRNISYSIWMQRAKCAKSLRDWLVRECETRHKTLSGSSELLTHSDNIFATY